VRKAAAEALAKLDPGNPEWHEIIGEVNRIKRGREEAAREEIRYKRRMEAVRADEHRKSVDKADRES